MDAIERELAFLDNIQNPDDIVDTVEFDRNLPSEHTYLPGVLTTIQGHSDLQVGWQGTIPCWCHHSVIFPGETIPIHVPDISNNRVGMEAVIDGRIFGLICPEKMIAGTTKMSDYGVVCEVFESSKVEGSPNNSNKISFRARAKQRFCLKDEVNWNALLQDTMHVSNCEIKILPDIILRDPLLECRLFSGLPRTPESCNRKKLSHADAALTPWPKFAYDVFSVNRLVDSLKQYFKKLSHESLPEDVLTLSYYVATNLTIPIEERFEMLKVDNAILRLYMELNYLNKHIVVCCLTCKHEICNTKEIFAMSKEGFYSNYCNVGGYVHDIMTVRTAFNLELRGRRSMEFTWFPGYYWTIGCCSSCQSHIGWEFTAERPELRPRRFWGLTRNSITTVDCLGNYYVM